MLIIQRFFGGMAIMVVFWFGLSALVGQSFRGLGHVKVKGFRGNHLNIDGADRDYSERWTIPSAPGAQPSLSTSEPAEKGPLKQFHRPNQRKEQVKQVMR